MSLERLDEVLRKDSAQRATDAGLDAQRARLLASPSTADSRAGWRWGRLVVLAAAAGAAFVVGSRFSTTSTPVFEAVAVDGTRLEVGATAQGTAMSFSDGSTVDVKPGSSARLVALSEADGVRVRLEQGRLSAVVPKRERAWVVEAGGVEVLVSGARVAMEWSAATLFVHVEEGAAVVRAPGGDVRLGAGESWSTPKAPSAEVQPPTLAPEEPAAAPAPPVRRDPSPRTSPSVVPTWKRLAEDERYEEAMAQVDQEGEVRVVRAAAPWDLVLLADAARLTGRTPLAARLLEAVRSKAKGTAPATQAAFRLGRLHFQSARPAEAAQWFSQFLSEAPGSEQAEDARGLLMESLTLAGQGPAARRAATDYLSNHPDGPYAARARVLTKEP